MVPRIGEVKSEAIGNSSDLEMAEPSTSGSNACMTGEYVERVCQRLGISNMTEAASLEAAKHTTFVVRRLIADATRFAHFGRRLHLCTEDLDGVMQSFKMPAHWGVGTRNAVPFRLAASGGRDVFITEDSDIELAPIYKAAAQKIPCTSTIRDMANHKCRLVNVVETDDWISFGVLDSIDNVRLFIMAHWLAIDGNQPAVPENPVPDGGNQTLASNNEEDEAARLVNMMKTGRKTEQVAVKTTTTHSLSLEQQVYFKEVLESIMGSDDAKRTESLHSLASDAGLQPLVARFAITVAEGVKCNIVNKNLAILIYLMRIVQSLVNNPHISLEKHLHELLPAILSCILSKALCSRPEIDNHWTFREFASKLLANICRKYQVLDVQSRITRVLTKAWTDPPPGPPCLPTFFGSVSALNQLGLETVRVVVVPRIPSLWDIMSKVDRSQPLERASADKLQNFVVKVLVDYYRNQRPPDLKNFDDCYKLFGGFAELVYKHIGDDMVAAAQTLAPSVQPTAVRTMQSQPRVQRMMSYQTVGPNTPQRMAAQQSHQQIRMVSSQQTPIRRAPGQGPPRQ